MPFTFVFFYFRFGISVSPKLGVKKPERLLTVFSLNLQAILPISLSCSSISQFLFRSQVRHRWGASGTTLLNYLWGQRCCWQQEIRPRNQAYALAVRSVCLVWPRGGRRREKQCNRPRAAGIRLADWGTFFFDLGVTERGLVRCFGSGHKRDWIIQTHEELEMKKRQALGLCLCAIKKRESHLFDVGSVHLSMLIQRTETGGSVLCTLTAGYI